MANNQAGGARVCLGVITGAHGVKGWVKIKPFTEMAEGLMAYGPLSDESGARVFDILETREANAAVLARIAGVGDRDGAQALHRTRLYVAREALPDIEEDETWYHADLIGLEAVDDTGALIGKVTAVYDFGGGDLLEISPAGGKSGLLPFTRTHVPKVDIAARRITVVPPEGLFGDGGENDTGGA